MLLLKKKREMQTLKLNGKGRKNKKLILGNLFAKKRAENKPKTIRILVGRERFEPYKAWRYPPQLPYFSERDTVDK